LGSLGDYLCFGFGLQSTAVPAALAVGSLELLRGLFARGRLARSRRCRRLVARLVGVLGRAAAAGDRELALLGRGALLGRALDAIAGTGTCGAVVG